MIERKNQMYNDKAFFDALMKPEMILISHNAFYKSSMGHLCERLEQSRYIIDKINKSAMDQLEKSILVDHFRELNALHLKDYYRIVQDYERFLVMKGL